MSKYTDDELLDFFLEYTEDILRMVNEDRERAKRFETPEVHNEC